MKRLLIQCTICMMIMGLTKAQSCNRWKYAVVYSPRTIFGLGGCDAGLQAINTSGIQLQRSSCQCGDQFCWSFDRVAMAASSDIGTTVIKLTLDNPVYTPSNAWLTEDWSGQTHHYEQAPGWMSGATTGINGFYYAVYEDSSACGGRSGFVTTRRSLMR